MIYSSISTKKFTKKEGDSWITERFISSRETAPYPQKILRGFQVLKYFLLYLNLFSAVLYNFSVIIRIYFPHSMSVFLGSL